MRCRFCDFQELKEEIVYSNENAYVVISNNPLSYGHILVIPRRHVERLEELSMDEITSLFYVVRKLILKLLKAVRAKDYNLFINAGPRANQSIDHLHIHIVPRRAHCDRLDVFFSAFATKKDQQLSKQAIAEVADSIKRQLEI